MVSGFHAVTALLGRDPDAIVALHIDVGRRDRRMQALVAQAAAAGVAVQRTPRAELAQLAGEVRHQGVVALCRASASASAGSLEDALETLEERALLLVLDGVQDPHNLGACLRSAEAAGAHGVIVPRDRACPVTAAVRRAAAGAAESIAVYRVANLVRTLSVLKRAGLWLVGLDDGAERSLYATDLTGPLALVLGAEQRGLRPLIREHCDYLVRIPMAGSVPSLNVSVAAGIALFEALRQRT